MNYEPINNAQQWYNNCLPHHDIREGHLDESTFAANLNEVAMGMAAAEYANPAQFFDKTYITAGLRDMINRVVRALNGEQTGNRIISLQTGFGGGKTHSLIALYHVVKGGAQIVNLPAGAQLLAMGVQPHFDRAKVAVFTDNTNDVLQGRPTADDIRIHTLWGEIAYQLGGPRAYERIRPNDELRTAPTSQLLKPILEEAGTSLILIDELANYCCKALGSTVGQGTLCDQTNSFLQTLTETVAQVPGCVLIVTLPASALEVSASREGREVLSALKNRLDRYGTSVKPVDDEEVFEVVRRRLFERIHSTQVVDDVALRYRQMLHNRITDLPQHSDGTDYVRKIKQSYPFHPELIDTFRLRWGSFPNFQRTRGVLRLLAAIVQELWNRRYALEGSQLLIHTADVNLAGINALTDMVTHLMGSQWESVMTADVYGTSSNAHLIDESYQTGSIKTYHLTQGVATTLLMASVVSKATNAGLSVKQIKLCMLRPKAFNHSDIDTALRRLEDNAHYLHASGIGEKTYHFEAKANVNILLVQAKASIAAEAIEAELVERLRRVATLTSGPMEVLAVPSGDIPERRSLTLVVMHPTYTATAGARPLDNTARAIEQIATKRGNSERLYRNTMLFLLCSENGKAQLVDRTGDYLAAKKIIDEYRNRLDNDQMRDLQNKRNDFSQAVDTALVKAYCVVARHCVRQGGTQTTLLSQYAGSLAAQITQCVPAHLKEEEWLVDSIGRAVLSANNLLPKPEAPVRVKDIYEAFLRFDDKPMISGQAAVVKTVNRYCSEGLFNVAVGLQGNYTKVYAHEQIPFLDATQDDYWLVDTNVTMNPVATMPSTGSTGPSEQTQGAGWIGVQEGSQNAAQDSLEGFSQTPTTGTTQPYGQAATNATNAPEQPRLVHKLTIEGRVAIENWSEIFRDFINPLKKNRLDIEIKLKAQSTQTNPITDRSQVYANVKESASQLGMKFTEE